jgi:hypothetical protein
MSLFWRNLCDRWQTFRRRHELLAEQLRRVCR